MFERGDSGCVYYFENENDAPYQLPIILTALANLRTRPDALAHFLLAVPDEVLRRCGVILAEAARRND